MENSGQNLKFTVPLADGLIVEAVYYGSGTLCVSSQAGCAMRCPFCASGSRGLLRNLSAGEMILQLTAAADRGLAPKRVTVSGIGEPLHNSWAVLHFMDICRRRGLPVSLTTTGSPLQTLREFLPLSHNGLMLSLHAGSAADSDEFVHSFQRKPATDSGVIRPPFGAQRRWCFLSTRSGRFGQRQQPFCALNLLSG